MERLRGGSGRCDGDLTMAVAHVVRNDMMGTINVLVLYGSHRGNANSRMGRDG